MTRLVFNRDGGKTDEYGHMIGFSWHIQGDVIGGLIVTPTDTPGMSVKVDSGIAALPRNSGGKMYRVYCGLDAPETLTIPTANSSNPRIDTIVLYVDMKVTPSTGVTNNSNNMCKLAVVQGAPSSSPQGASESQIQNAVGAGNPFIGLSKVRVDAGVTQITYNKCTDIRDFASPGFVDGRFMKDKSINYKGYGDSSIGRNAIDWTQFNENKYSTSEINTHKTLLTANQSTAKCSDLTQLAMAQKTALPTVHLLWWIASLILMLFLTWLTVSAIRTVTPTRQPRTCSTSKQSSQSITVCNNSVTTPGRMAQP